MKPLRIMLWSAIFLIGGFLAWSTLGQLIGGNQPTGNFGTVKIEGDFKAVNTKGETVTRDAMLGRPHAVFFGFTHCPDVCPTTLYEAGLWLQEIGDKGDDIDVYFVTVDPERDTAEVLGDYLRAFDSRISGITGDADQIDKMVKAWRVYARKVDTEDGYTVDHTATTFLMDAEGHLVSTISYGEDSDVAVKKIRNLIDKSA